MEATRRAGASGPTKPINRTFEPFAYLAMAGERAAFGLICPVEKREKRQEHSREDCTIIFVISSQAGAAL